MKKLVRKLGTAVMFLLIIGGLGILVINVLFAAGVIDLGDGRNVTSPIIVSRNELATGKTKALMLMLASGEVEDLVSFVDEMQLRDIPGLLLVDQTYVSSNCSILKQISQQNIEIGVVAIGESFVELGYEDQYQIMSGVKGSLQNCLGDQVRVFAWEGFTIDLNTIKAAEELSFETVLSRGSGARATVYQLLDYDIKVLLASSVSSYQCGEWSLSDRSCYANESSPTQFSNQIRIGLDQNKISPMSYVEVSGSLPEWKNVFIEFFESDEIDWLGYEEFVSTDEIVGSEDLVGAE